MCAGQKGRTEEGGGQLLGTLPARLVETCHPAVTSSSFLARLPLSPAFPSLAGHSPIRTVAVSLQDGVADPWKPLPLRKLPAQLGRGLYLRVELLSRLHGVT